MIPYNIRDHYKASQNNHTGKYNVHLLTKDFNQGYNTKSI